MNIFCVAYYVLTFFFIKKKLYLLYVIMVGSEISIYMSVSTILMGFSPGFHLCILGIVVLIFYCGYFSKKMLGIVKPLPWAICLLVDYIFLFFYSEFNQPYYEYNRLISSILFVVHSVVVFGFVIAFLYVFSSHVLKLEKSILSETKVDKLTNIANRKALEQYYDTLEDKNNYVLAILDIDDFKMVNDTYGHICGDFILKEIARITQDYLKEEFVSRFGGEEFVIIVKEVNDYETTCLMLDELRKYIGNYSFDYEGRNINITITMGIAKFINYKNVDSWVEVADEKLYLGKENGKNKIVF